MCIMGDFKPKQDSQKLYKKRWIFTTFNYFCVEKDVIKPNDLSQIEENISNAYKSIC